MLDYLKENYWIVLVVVFLLIGSITWYNYPKAKAIKKAKASKSSSSSKTSSVSDSPKSPK